MDNYKICKNWTIIKSVFCGYSDGNAFIPAVLPSEGRWFFFPAESGWQQPGEGFACFSYFVSNSFISFNRKNTQSRHTQADETGNDWHVFCSQTKIIGTFETRPIFG